MNDPLAGRPLRILLVENHADTLRWLTLYLEELGHTVHTARTLAAARAVLQTWECERQRIGNQLHEKLCQSLAALSKNQR